MDVDKTGQDRHLNLKSQPPREFRVFNNPKVVTAGWYPLISSRKIKLNQVQSFRIGAQRVAVYRTSDGKLHAMDAYCPHMGADLANGKIVNNRLQCYFHQWEFDTDGSLASIPGTLTPPLKCKQMTYPVEDKYGFIWVYSGEMAPSHVTHPPGLEDVEVTGIHLGGTKLFVHHHILMLSAIDLQHFSTVHKVDLDFTYEVESRHDSEWLWTVKGVIPNLPNWRARLAKWLLGKELSYKVVFSGGNLVGIQYGTGARFRGKGWKIPPLFILWGCRPLAEGVSEVETFLVQSKAKTLGGKLNNAFLYLLSVMLLALLKDDDVKAYPHMRFSPANLIAKDKSVTTFIQFIEHKLKVSLWSFDL